MTQTHSYLHEYTAVIPTIGTRSAIESVIHRLEKQTNRPVEILIVVPMEYKKEFDGISAKFQRDRIQILYCPRKGQVKQRIFGFKTAQTKLVLQLDDDVLLDDADLMNKLIKSLNRIMDERKTTKISIAPLIRFGNMTKNKIFNKEIFTFFNSLIVKRPRIYSMGGGSYPKNAFGFLGHKPEYIQSEWLPGGIVLSHMDNVNWVNYYPFKGRAEGEDILDSIEKTKKGGSMYLCLNLQLGLPGEFLEASHDSLYRQFMIAICANRRRKKWNNLPPLLKYVAKRLVYDIRKSLRWIG